MKQSDHFKGVWILSVPSVYLSIPFTCSVTTQIFWVSLCRASGKKIVLRLFTVHSKCTNIFGNDKPSTKIHNKYVKSSINNMNATSINLQLNTCVAVYTTHTTHTYTPMSPLRLMMVQAAIKCNLESRLPAIKIYGTLQELIDIKYLMRVPFNVLRLSLDHFNHHQNTVCHISSK